MRQRTTDDSAGTEVVERTKGGSAHHHNKLRLGPPRAILSVRSSIVRPIIWKQVFLSQGEVQRATPLQQSASDRSSLLGMTLNPGVTAKHRENKINLYRKHSNHRGMKCHVELIRLWESYTHDQINEIIKHLKQYCVLNSMFRMIM